MCSHGRSCLRTARLLATTCRGRSRLVWPFEDGFRNCHEYRRSEDHYLTRTGNLVLSLGCEA